MAERREVFVLGSTGSVGPCAASVLETLGAGLPLGRAAQPGEVAAALAYLIATPSVTGDTLFVDSGESLRARSVILGAS